MKKTFVVCLAVVGLLALGGSAFAVKDARDAVPAATLLLPYFEVDLSTLDGVTTLFSINNASAVAQIAHVTVWSSDSIVVFDFDVYLSGYDVASFNMRDVLNLRLGPAVGNFYIGDGDWSDPNGGNDYTYCAQIFPNYPNYDASSPGFKQHVQEALTGRISSVTGVRYSCSQADQIARGYLTIDVVNACNIYSPQDLANPGLYRPFLEYDNVLWGDYFYVNPGQNFAQGDTLVHIEAFPGAYGAGQATFYRRYNGINQFDQREPLATTYASRFILGGAFSGGTSYAVWREGLVRAPGQVCTAYSTLDYAFFDEEENPWQKFCISGDPTCLFATREAVRVRPNQLFVTMPYNFGWHYWNLNWNAGSGVNARQAFVSTFMDANGRFSVGYQAIGLDNANAPILISINPFD